MSKPESSLTRCKFLDLAASPAGVVPTSADGAARAPRAANANVLRGLEKAVRV
jgi:hypothetical protein